ncbi:TRAP transporter small permease [Oscillospiraceae bacterium LTW-04]|nr:TRAP transporter small permease [Oscillospiraceae bacterium MB24-C1]
MKVLKWLDESLEETILVVLLLIMSLAMGAQIIARYIFNSPLSWSEELSRFLFVWSGFLSISYCFKKQISIKIEQLVSLLPQKVATVFKIIEKTTMLLFYIYMVPFAWTYFNNAITSGQLSPAMQIPMSFIYIAPLIGFILSIIRLTQGVVEKSLVFVRGAKAGPGQVGGGQ